MRYNDPRNERARHDTKFIRRAISTFPRVVSMRNALIHCREARDMLMTLMFKRAVRRAGRAESAL